MLFVKSVIQLSVDFEWGFVTYLSLSKQSSGQYLKMGHHHITPNPFQFTIYQSSTIL